MTSPLPSAKVHEGLLDAVFIYLSITVFILKIDLGSDSVEVEQPADFNLVDLEAVVGLFVTCIMSD